MHALQLAVSSKRFLIIVTYILLALTMNDNERLSGHSYCKVTVLIILEYSGLQLFVKPTCVHTCIFHLLVVHFLAWVRKACETLCFPVISNILVAFFLPPQPVDRQSGQVLHITNTTRSCVVVGFQWGTCSTVYEHWVSGERRRMKHSVHHFDLAFAIRVQCANVYNGENMKSP